MRWAASLGAAVVVLGLTLSACGDDRGGDAVTAGATTCTVATDPSGPMTTADGGLLVPPVAAPGEWVDPPQQGFDWDGDGAADSLGFDQADGSVSVTWADGALTVTGVRSDFTGEPGQPVEPGGDPFLEQPTESGPPSESAVEDGLAAPIPAAVADVTGDDLLDLIVVDGGTVSVLVGAGADSASVSVAQDAIGDEVAGWRNPPIVPEAPAGFSQDQPAVPYDQATIVPRWDLTGDGVADWVVESNLPRALGPVTAYAGRPCG
jgi:hypothetical protein